MRRPSGFVPINYRVTGWILLALGGITLVVRWLAALLAGFTFPGALSIFGVVAALVGLYLLVVSPREQ